MFKIALGAGHGLTTSGKRCLKALDPNETREWVLNDRICDYVQYYLKDYKDYSLLRVDDSDDGKTDVALADRVKAVNNFAPNIYISVHHNAGASGTTAGGIMAFTHPKASQVSVAWRDDLYNALIKQTGLKGNRANPKATADFYVLRKSNAPAVLLELGFMDSKTDVPVILTKEYAQKCARAIVDVIVKRGSLTKKKTSTTTAAPAATTTNKGTLYRVQVGAYKQKANAEKMKKELTEKGYKPIIVTD